MDDSWSTAFQSLADPAPPPPFDWPEHSRRIVRRAEPSRPGALASEPVLTTQSKIAAFLALRSGGARVIEVARAVGVACPTALRHLRRMRDAGAVAGGGCRGETWRPCVEQRLQAA